MARDIYETFLVSTRTTSCVRFPKLRADPSIVVLARELLHHIEAIVLCIASRLPCSPAISKNNPTTWHVDTLDCCHRGKFAPDVSVMAACSGPKIRRQVGWDGVMFATNTGGCIP